MTARRRAAAVFAAAVLLTGTAGCSRTINGTGTYAPGLVSDGTGTTQPDYTPPEDTYPQLHDRTVPDTVREVGTPGLNKYTDGQIEELAHAACSDFDSGSSLAQTIADGDSTELAHDDVLAIVFTAVLAYCPQYRHLLP